MAASSSGQNAWSTACSPHREHWPGTGGVVTVVDRDFGASGGHRHHRPAPPQALCRRPGACHRETPLMARTPIEKQRRYRERLKGARPVHTRAPRWPIRAVPSAPPGRRQRARPMWRSHGSSARKIGERSTSRRRDTVSPYTVFPYTSSTVAVALLTRLRLASLRIQWMRSSSRSAIVSGRKASKMSERASLGSEREPAPRRPLPGGCLGLDRSDGAPTLPDARSTSPPRPARRRP